MNDTERSLWVQNDEGLYTWWQQTKKGLRRFIQEHRSEIDEHIHKAVQKHSARESQNSSE